MLYALIAMFIIVVIMSVLYFLTWKNAGALFENLNALDQGMTEVTDAYHTDMLQYEEMLEQAHDDAHRENSNYVEMRDKNLVLIKNAEIDRSALHELRQRLDIAQVIILEHDLNCLPHIMLTSMVNDIPDCEQ